MPARSLRIIFSATARFESSLEASKPANESPPALPRSLWHVAQYWVTMAVCSAGPSAPRAGPACDTAGRGAGDVAAGAAALPLGAGA
jgi:hypothetical protein